MKYIILILFVIVFNGCSAKCMESTYNCNSTEKGIKTTFETINDVGEEVNKIIPFYLLNDMIIKSY